MDIELTEVDVNIVDCQWVKTGKLPIGLLNNFSDITRDLADGWHEIKIGNIVASLLHRQLTHQSVGNFPGYDIVFDDGRTFEIKLSTFESGKIFIETGSEVRTIRQEVPKKKPSGLNKTTSNYYILLNPGRIKNPNGSGRITVMKARLIKTDVLRMLSQTTAEMHISRGNEKKSYGFELDILDENFNDGFVGYFEYNKSKEEVNLNRFTPFNKNLPDIREEYNKG